MNAWYGWTAFQQHRDGAVVEQAGHIRHVRGDVLGGQDAAHVFGQCLRCHRRVQGMIPKNLVRSSTPAQGILKTGGEHHLAEIFKSHVGKGLDDGFALAGQAEERGVDDVDDLGAYRGVLGHQMADAPEVGMLGAHFLVDLDDDGGLGRQLDLADDLLGVIKALGIEINGGHGMRIRCN